MGSSSSAMTKSNCVQVYPHTIRVLEHGYNSSNEEESTLENSDSSDRTEWPDLFWKGKKKLFERYNRQFIKRIDSRAHSFEGSHNPDPIDLIYYLTKNCENDNTLKARSLAVWIAAHVTYDESANIYQCSQPKFVLKERRTICSGFCRLYEFLCGEAGVECKYVSGLGRGSDFDPADSFCLHPETNRLCDQEPNEHAWNLVKLHDQWYCVDLTWAAGILNHSEDKSLEFFSQWQEEWFICEPQTFLSTHFPFKHRLPHPKWQNIAEPSNDVKGWGNTPLITPVFNAFGLALVDSHKALWVEASEENFFFLTFNNLLDLAIDFTARLTKNGVSVKNRDMVSNYQQKISVKGFLAEPGEYKLELWGCLRNAEEVLETKKLLCVYGIKSQSCEETLPLPGPAKPYWGPTYWHKHFGITSISHTDPIIDMRDSMLSLSFTTERKICAFFDFRAFLFIGESAEEENEQNWTLDDHACSWWREDEEIQLRVNINTSGRYYRLTVCGREPKYKEWLNFANYLIIK